jgi:diguanylate cyclase (GGDEF)-like protein
MTPRTQWTDLTAQQLVRYEALFKLLDDIQVLEEIPAIAQRVATQWKYFANVASWRMVIARDAGYQVIDASRGQAQVREVPVLDAWDQAHWALQRPRLLQPADGTLQAPPPEHLVGRAVTEIQVLPLLRAGRCVALLSAAARHEAFSELDKKFIRLFGGHLADRISAILLRRQAMEVLIGKATRDALTGLFNRGTILERLAGQLAMSQRAGQPLAVILGDIDHFKAVNDSHGHQAGDEVLRGVAHRLQARVRSGDSLGRYGGEEFLLVLYPCSAEEAGIAAEHFRRVIADGPFTLPDVQGTQLPVTISLGTASNALQPEVPLQDLLRQADDALYRAKALGRNRVEPGVAQPASN